MALTKFKLVDTTTKAVFYKGDTIPVDRIDDALAEQLVGKTHVLERLAPPRPALAVMEAEPHQEAPAPGAKRK